MQPEFADDTGKADPLQRPVQVRPVTERGRWDCDLKAQAHLKGTAVISVQLTVTLE